MYRRWVPPTHRGTVQMHPHPRRAQIPLVSPDHRVGVLSRKQMRKSPGDCSWALIEPPSTGEFNRSRQWRGRGGTRTLAKRGLCSERSCSHLGVEVDGDRKQASGLPQIQEEQSQGRASPGGRPAVLSLGWEVKPPQKGSSFQPVSRTINTLFVDPSDGSMESCPDPEGSR